MHINVLHKYSIQIKRNPSTVMVSMNITWKIDNLKKCSVQKFHSHLAESFHAITALNITLENR